MLRHLILILVVFAVTPLSASAEGCRFSAERALDMDARGLASLALDTGDGDLVVEGVAGLGRIEIRAKACADDAETLARLQLVQERQGDTARAATMTADDDASSASRRGYATMDVQVRMPDTVRLDLRDSSGDLRVHGLHGGVSVRDSSGDIRLADLGGGVSVADTSGDIEVDGIDGDFTVVSDSSGSIDIADVRGDALVREDSSGDIGFRHVDGNARVDRDSSGNIDFDGIGRDASVGSDSSGAIRAHHVRGNFTVERKAEPAEIESSDVGGKVSLPRA